MQARQHRATVSIDDPRWMVERTDDGSCTLIFRTTGDTYHSESGALAETRQVYLHNSGAASRIATGAPTTVLEVGLGTGMGLLLTLEAAVKANAPLRYVAIENNWPPAGVLRHLNPQDWLEVPEIARRYLAWRQTLPAEVPAGIWNWQMDRQRVLAVHVTDARSWEWRGEQRFDAIYLDPFAPASNPELWELTFLAKLRRAIRVGGKLTTYCVSRSVREAVAAAGFRVERVPGPAGGKREVLIATACGGDDSCDNTTVS